MTKTQEDTLRFIIAYVLEEYSFPTYKEIAERFNITTKGAYCNVIPLKKKGYLEMNKKIRLAEKGKEYMKNEF